MYIKVGTLAANGSVSFPAKPQVFQYFTDSGAIQPTAASQSDPITHAALVVPNDLANLAANTRALYIAAAGDVRLTTVGGETLTWPGLTIGWHPICATKIFASNTSANGIVAGW